MRVKIIYDENQLEEVSKFISNNNPSFLDQIDHVRNSIIRSMERIALDADHSQLSTMGFTIIGDREFEGIDNDENIIYYEILVDLTVGKPHASNIRNFIISSNKI